VGEENTSQRPLGEKLCQEFILPSFFFEAYGLRKIPLIEWLGESTYTSIQRRMLYPGSLRGRTTRWSDRPFWVTWAATPEF
jgi:hypothetical protein